MAIAETAKLMSSLDLDTRKFDAGVVKANRGLKSMESTAFKVGEGIGRGINRAAHNIKKIAEVGVVALAGAVALGVKSLADLERTQNQTEAVIKSTGGAAKVTEGQVRDLATSLESLSTVDDKVIQDGENLLLTFTNIGSNIFPQATKAALDYALALANGNVENVDLKSASIQLGKALNDPAVGFTALKKAGVSFSTAQIKILKGSNALNKEEAKHYFALLKTNKVEAKRYMATTIANKRLAAQKLILAEINKEFGKSSEASGKGPEAVMRRLADAGENVSQILARATLPVLERLGTFLTTKLSDPKFLAAVDAFGIQLGIAGGKVLDFLEKFDFTAIGNALKTGAGFAKDIINAFLGAPTWLQEAIVTGWGLNKLTGGALTDIFGTLASGLIKGVLGINAGIVNVNGPVAGVGAAGGAGAGIGVAQLIPLAGLVAVGQAAGEAAAQEINKNKGTDFHMPAGFLDIPTQVSNLVQAVDVLVNGKPNRSDRGTGNEDPRVVKSIDALKGVTSSGFQQLSGLFATSPDRNGNTDPKPVKTAIDNTTSAVSDLKGKIADDLMTTKDSLSTAAGKTTTAATNAGNYVGRTVQAGASTVAAAVRAAVPTVITNVSVSATTVVKTNTVINRYGSSGGDRNGQASRQTPI